MNLDDPIAFFITWTLYGTHLQGDELGWRRRRKGYQSPQQELVEWREKRLKYPIIVLTCEQRTAVEKECRRLCEYRGWRVWALTARSTHCHIVVTARNHSGDAPPINSKPTARESYVNSGRFSATDRYGPSAATGNASTTRWTSKPFAATYKTLKTEKIVMMTLSRSSTETGR